MQDLYFSSYCEVFGFTSLGSNVSGMSSGYFQRSALSEINSDVVEYFNPDDEYEIKESMRKVLFEEGYKNNLIEKGYIHYKKFSWEKNCLSNFKIYRLLNFTTKKLLMKITSISVLGIHSKASSGLKTIGSFSLKEVFKRTGTLVSL